MPINPGTYELTPRNAQLIVHTRRTGGAAKAGHDLTIEVNDWSGRLEVGEGGGSVSLTADSSSLRVLVGRGGMMALGSDDKDNIRQTIDDEILKRAPIEFRSTGARPSGSGLHVDGELELLGTTHPLSFELAVTPDGRLTGSATIKQSDWGIKPYSALFGALKVADEIVVTIAGKLVGSATAAG